MHELSHMIAWNYYCMMVILEYYNIVAVNGTQMCTLIEMLYCSQSALGKSNLFYTFSNTTHISFPQHSKLYVMFDGYYCRSSYNSGVIPSFAKGRQLAVM